MKFNALTLFALVAAVVADDAVEGGEDASTAKPPPKLTPGLTLSMPTMPHTIPHHTVTLGHPHMPKEHLTTSTVYTTTTKTIINCPEKVPSCPAHSTTVTTVTISVSTTVCPITSSGKPAPPPKETAKPYPPASSSSAKPMPPASKPPPAATSKPVGSTAIPKPTSPSVIVSGAGKTIQRAGGALVAVALVAAMI